MDGKVREALDAILRGYSVTLDEAEAIRAHIEALEYRLQTADAYGLQCDEDLRALQTRVRELEGDARRTSPVTSPVTPGVTPGATPGVRILADAMNAEIRQLEGKATWVSQSERIARLRAAIDSAMQENQDD